MTTDLFSEQMDSTIVFADGALWLRGFALPDADAICQMLVAHLDTHPPQQMMTPMGHKMSVLTTSFGDVGWVGTKKGYGYAKVNPYSQQVFPAMPQMLLDLARRAANQAGYSDFVPDTCLVNCYEVGSKMGLHQDKDEEDFSQPIVSVSFGLPITFLFGGLTRAAQTKKMPLVHGDVLVWGGQSRLCFHGVLALKAGHHPLLGSRRINLTFRKAGKM
ncbi:MAG: DNA oxidative demethylase AlkB [Methylophilaceae bacterium]|nr:DNA oxidative demethylase AlkB [Methylophilaceae bacterium]MDG1445162.1 DNA oxidative demethylase AlkB [Methylophilaceae bacterium]MDG2292910.1 DNA oxidative demethylase AlkB [Methylophilaceae bacterium]